MTVVFDSITVVALAVALGLALRRAAGILAVRGLLVLLLAVTLLYAVLIWCEWADLQHGLEGYEDFAGALQPMLWAFLLYAFLQHGLNADLRRSEQRLRLTLDSIGDGVIATDAAGRVTRMNPVAEQLTGWLQHEASGRSLPEVFPIISALDGAPVENPVARVLATGTVVGLANHTLLIARDGSSRHIADSAAPILGGDRVTRGVVLVFRDVSDEYALRERLDENEKRLALTLEAAGLGTWDWDVPSGRVVFDERWAAMLGERLEDLEQRFETWHDRVHPDDLAAVKKRLQQHLDGERDDFEAEYRLAMHDGGWCWILDKGRVTQRDEAGRPLRMVGTHDDRSERRRIEDRMRSSARMEAVGRLAGGVAHDLNNLLTPILGYAEMLATDAELGADARASASQILRAGGSARDLIGQLLAFGRRQSLQMRPMDLNAAVESFGRLLRRTIPANVTIDWDLEPGLPPIVGDVGQIEQILMNLAVNAADAMPDGGSLMFRSAVVGGDGMSEGRSVCLTVRDTGRGMSAEVLDRVFEPFFSTKGEHGTGLGLATVHGIVQQHGGRIEVTSEPGAGTTFEVVFPLAKGSATPATVVEAGDVPRGRGERVLIVEDNEMVRQLAQALLELQGYEVVTAAEGQRALEYLESAREQVALLLTDMVMPGLNGRELFERARRKNPGLRALFMSGYAMDTLGEQGASHEQVHLLQKPFSTRQLASCVRAALDAAPSGGSPR